MTIYLDHNATTHLLQKVKDYLHNICIDYQPQNTSSIHQFGRQGYEEIEQAKSNILSTIFKNKSTEYDIIFTSGGTESNNQIIKSFNNILIGSTEHPSIMQPAKTKNGKIITCNNIGIIEEESLIRAIQTNKPKENNRATKTNPILVSISIANNETGVIQNIKQLSEIAHSMGCVVHCDYTQGLGKLSQNIADMQLDYMTISAHKIGGLMGIGGLIYNKTAPKPHPLILGGGQEHGLRSGTQSPILSHCFEIAVKESLNNINQNIATWLDLRNYIENFTEQNEGLIISKKANRLPNTSLIYMPTMNGEQQLINFDLNGIMVSRGSACSSGIHQKSNTLSAMQIPDHIANSVIRISTGSQNNKEEIKAFCKHWLEISLRNKYK